MIIADTGFWVALFDPKDNYHLAVRSYVPQINEPLITTLPVITEVCYLLQERHSAMKTVAFLQAQRERQLFSLFALELSHFLRIEQLMIKYADLPMDLADASLVILAEELGHGCILSTDRRDFHTYRWKNHQPFNNLLEGVL
ncbi:MAG: PIN domain-containing protein [Methylococcales bacterium]